MARGWKRFAEALLAKGGASALGGFVNRPLAIILAYHNIVPTGERPAGDLSLHMDQEAFAKQLDFLVARACVVPLGDLGTPGTVEPGRLRVSITFDDAYRGTMTAGVQELERRGLSASVFVPPGLLGSDGFWWDRLSPPGKPLDPTVRRHALDALAGDGPAILAWADREGHPVEPLPRHAQAVTEAELFDALEHEGITLGAHTWSHPNLARVSQGRCDDELTRSKKWLASRTDRYLDWVAYPYGLRNDDVVRSASRLFEGALLVEGGPAGRRGRYAHPIHETPRLNIPRGLSLDGLALRLAGLLA